MTKERLEIAAIWLVALLAAVTIGLFVDSEQQLTWVSVAMLLIVFTTAIVQLIDPKAEGFISRMALSLSGAAVVLGIASLIFVAMGAEAETFAAASTTATQFAS